MDFYNSSPQSPLLQPCWSLLPAEWSALRPRTNRLITIIVDSLASNRVDLPQIALLENTRNFSVGQLAVILLLWELTVR